MAVGPASSTAIGSFLIGLLGVILGSAIKILSNLKSEYQNDTHSVQNDRLSEVCNVMGQFVADAYEFMEDNSDRRAEHLSDDEKAAVAITETLDENDLSTLNTGLKEYYQPVLVYDKCRIERDRCIYCLFGSAIVGGVPPISVLLLPQIGLLSRLLNYTAIGALLLLLIGAWYFFRHYRHRSSLEEMIENQVGFRPEE